MKIAFSHFIIIIKKTVKNLVSHLISSGLLCVEAKEAKRTESLKYYLVEKYSGNQAYKLDDQVDTILSSVDLLSME